MLTFFKYRDNKLHYEDNSYTRKTDNSREYDIDQSGDVGLTFLYSKNHRIGF